MRTREVGNVLFNTPERTKVASCDADDAEDGGHQQDPEILKDGEHNPAQDHQHRARHQHPPPAHAVRDQRQECAQEDIAQQGQRHEDADLMVRVFQRGKEDGCAYGCIDKLETSFKEGKTPNSKAYFILFWW